MTNSNDHSHGHDHDHEHSHAHEHAHEHGHDHDSTAVSEPATAPEPASEPPLAKEHGHAHGHRHGHGGNHGHDHGPIDPDLAESRQGVRVLMISLVLLGITAIVQAIVVYFTGSVALLADTVHNVGDALTAVPLAIAFILARRPPSARFQYGLGRAEDLAGLAIVALIGFSAAYAFYASIERLINPQEPTYLLAGILAGVVGFIGNEAVAVYRIRQGRRMASAALIADGMHARTDGLTSLGVAGGLVLVHYGWQWADPVAGLIISAVIAKITWNAARDVGIRLLDGIKPDDLEPIEAVVRSLVPADAIERISARWMGHVIHVDLEIDHTLLSTVDVDGLVAHIEREFRAQHTRARTINVIAGAHVHAGYDQ